MLVSISRAGVAGDHGISGSGLGVTRWFRFLGLGVLGVVLLLELFFLGEFLDGDFFLLGKCTLDSVGVSNVRFGTFIVTCVPRRALL